VRGDALHHRAPHAPGLAVAARHLPRWLPGTSPADYSASRRALNSYERKDLETGAFDHSEVVI